MRTMFVIPAPGLQIVDPVQINTPAAMLPPEGREVDENDYWLRRVRDGDVTRQSIPAVGNVVASPAPQAPLIGA